MENNRKNRGTLTVDAFTKAATAKGSVDLDDHTPGEIAYLSHYICNRPVASLPCKPQKTRRVSEGVTNGTYALMPVQIIRAMDKVRRELAFNDCDATGATDRDVVVSVNETGPGYARIFDMPASEFGVYEHTLESDAGVLPQGAELTSVWTGGVRIVKEDTRETRAVKKINSVINNLVCYKDNGDVKSNCLSDSKVLEAWKLSSAANTVVQLLKSTGRDVPRDFVYKTLRDSPRARHSLWDKVSVSLGSHLKNTILTIPPRDGHAQWTRKVTKRPAARLVKKPIAMMAKMTSSICESGMGLHSVSQINGLPVGKETRSVMSICDDLDIPRDVNVVQLVNGNRNQCERLWRRHNCREDLLFLYPNNGSYMAAEFNKFFSKGQVRRGGVTGYHTLNKYDFGKSVLMYVDLTLSRVALSKKREIGETCKIALTALRDRYDRARHAKYFCFYAHAYAGHQVFWTKKNADGESDGCAHELGLGGVYDIGKKVEDSDMLFYASARYAVQNCIVTNFSRAGLDPIPISRIPHVYVNLMIWHHLHSIMRFVTLTFTDKVEGNNCTYRMFRPLRYYPLGDGKLSEILAMGDYDLTQYFVRNTGETILPTNLFDGKKNPKYEGDDDETESEASDSDEVLVEAPAEIVDEEGDDDEFDPFADADFTQETVATMTK